MIINFTIYFNLFLLLIFHFPSRIFYFPYQLLQEEFLNQLGKLLEITIENPYSFNDAQMVLRVIEKIISFGPEAKTLVESFCSESLQKLGSKFNVVKKANEILQPTLI